MLNYGEDKGESSSLNSKTIKNNQNKLMITGAVTHHGKQNFTTNSKNKVLNYSLNSRTIKNYQNKNNDDKSRHPP